MQKNILYLTLLLLFLSFLQLSPVYADRSEEMSLIIEVEGDPHLHAQYIEKNHPLIKVIARYDVLFQGLALQAKERHLKNIQNLPFVISTHPVHTYKSDAMATSSATKHLQQLQNEQTNFPHVLNNTTYTGKGVDIGVIDTGIDYEHPYLKDNYQGGYDVVDFDADPMETLPSEGMPTVHGTHVAGIIAAQGEFQGVAPDANIYGYRALGPGGRGTSVQVIAAMEQAIKDGMDIINLSLGNSINGPDYPTSTAVNKAVELGAIVVIANGNDGPEDWTVGSPATALKAISVGAMSPSKHMYVLDDHLTDKEIPLVSLPGTAPWESEEMFEIISHDHFEQPLHGKGLFLQETEESLYEIVQQAEQAGAAALFIQPLIDDMSMFQDETEQISIPVIILSEQDGKWLAKQLKKGRYIAKSVAKHVNDAIAPFSSRGPVTVDWTIKPDIIAPGTNILSTVPGGFQVFQGTSMAAPHVAGGLALIKEAQPSWTNEQIIQAMTTTAKPLYDQSGTLLPPSVQGTGLLQINQAINTETIIHDSNLSFGKIVGRQQTVSKQLTIENMTNDEQTYSFVIPKRTEGHTWELPQTFTLAPLEKKNIQIDLMIHPLSLEEGVHQGFLTLQRQDETYKLPYLFVHEAADYPMLMGFGLGLKPFTTDEYMYQFYLVEDVNSIHVDLFHATTLQFEQTLLMLDDIQAGLNKGTLNKQDVPKPGHYSAQFTIEQKNGEQIVYETDLWVE